MCLYILNIYIIPFFILCNDVNLLQFIEKFKPKEQLIELKIQLHKYSVLDDVCSTINTYMVI